MLRDYQKAASDAAIKCFEEGCHNGIIVLPTGTGKSFCIAEIARGIDSPLLVFAPTREIVLQDYDKIQAAGMYDVGIYSASAGEKNIRKITLATIGSVHNNMDDFRLFKYIIVDECHRVGSEGMYYQYITAREDRVVIGLTATPYRLVQKEFGAVSVFLNMIRPRIFDKVIHVTQVSEMMKKGFLCGVDYVDVYSRISFDLSKVALTASGMDYDEKSLLDEFDRTKFARDLLTWTVMAQRKRKCVIVFTRFIYESEMLVRRLSAYGINAAMITGEMPMKERVKAVNGIRMGKISVVVNVNCIAEGFDCNVIDTIIMASPTRSLSRYCQQIGRILRPAKEKRAMLIDMSGNFRRFGKIEDMRIERKEGLWSVSSNDRVLTGINSLMVR